MRIFQRRNSPLNYIGINKFQIISGTYRNKLLFLTIFTLLFTRTSMAYMALQLKKLKYNVFGLLMVITANALAFFLSMANTKTQMEGLLLILPLYRDCLTDTLVITLSSFLRTFQLLETSPKQNAL